uniref:Uncharacterized protein n=1 Tax=Rhizophora mucronata TaxID=61149 RepID=A0A2P2QSR9_RHIMU
MSCLLDISPEATPSFNDTEISLVNPSSPPRDSRYLKSWDRAMDASSSASIPKPAFFKISEGLRVI